jgi:hypothetical protein
MNMEPLVQQELAMETEVLEENVLKCHFVLKKPTEKYPMSQVRPVGWVVDNSHVEFGKKFLG